LFVDTQIITSKFIHQDEYSIIGIDEFKLYDSTAVNRLEKIAYFWRMDFRNRVVFTNNRFPVIIKHYEENFSKLPFEYSEIKGTKFSG